MSIRQNEAIARRFQEALNTGNTADAEEFITLTLARTGRWFAVQHWGATPHVELYDFARQEFHGILPPAQDGQAWLRAQRGQGRQCALSSAQRRARPGSAQPGSSFLHPETSWVLNLRPQSVARR